MSNAKRSLARQRAFLHGRPMPADMEGAGDEPLDTDPAVNDEGETVLEEPAPMPKHKPASKPKKKGGKRK